MNGVHIHLLLNHVPVIGLVLTVVVLGWGLWRRSDDVVRLGLLMLVVLGVTAIAVYLTGEPAEEAVEGIVGVSESMIESHEEAALLATIGMTVAGVLALALMVRHRNRPLPVRLVRGMLLVALVPTVMVAWAANLGGQIRHSEIRADASAAAATAYEDGESEED